MSRRPRCERLGALAGRRLLASALVETDATPARPLYVAVCAIVGDKSPSLARATVHRQRSG
jgi:hypothetical protein